MTVLDASALLALLNDEPGAEKVARYVAVGAAISSVNYAEVASKLCDYGMPDAEVKIVLGSLGLVVEPFNEAQALLCGSLRAQTRKAGLSLGDRACLAVTILAETTAITADREWKDLTDTSLEFIR